MAPSSAWSTRSFSPAWVGQRGKKKQTPFADKQSRRWLDAAIASAALCDAGASRVTVIADREKRHL